MNKPPEIINVKRLEFNKRMAEVIKLIRKRTPKVLGWKVNFQAYTFFSYMDEFGNLIKVNCIQ